jgi:hypothetical protein
LKRNPTAPDEADVKRLFELAAEVWRVTPARIMAGRGRRGATARNVVCVVLGETMPDAWWHCGYRSTSNQTRAGEAVMRYLDCPVDGARIHRLLDLVQAEMPWLLEKLVVPK